MIHRNRRPRRPRSAPRPAGAPRALDSTIVLGPSNSIWMVACDHKTGGGSEAEMWWRFCNRADPVAPDPANSHIWRMNATRSTALRDGANNPVAQLSTLAAAITASHALRCEDLCLFWHGIHINVPHHAPHPHRLRNKDEEYYGQVHRIKGDKRKAPMRDILELRPDQQHWFDNYRPLPSTFEAWLTEQNLDPHRDATRANRRVYNDNAQHEAGNRRAYRNIVNGRQERATWDRDWMFNWPVAPAGAQWPGRYQVAAYMNVLRAIHDHPTVKRVHLYGCDLADPRYMGPILDLTEDLAAGGAPNNGAPRKEDKEVWAYSDFTTTWSTGEFMYIAHGRGRSAALKGVYWDPSAREYQVVALFSEHGPLPGWQFRGRIENGRAIVEKFVERTPETEVIRPSWDGVRWPDGLGYHVEKINSDGIAHQTDFLSDMHALSPPPRGRRRRGPPPEPPPPEWAYPYTPFAVVPAIEHPEYGGRRAPPVTSIRAGGPGH